MAPFTLLDGGLGQELIRRGGGRATPLWSADFIRDRPGLIEAVHTEFFEAGAEVATVSAYTVTPSRLAAAGRSDEFSHLQEAAALACVRARDAASPTARIAGCLPPLPGSYRPQDRLSATSTSAEYERIVAAQSPHVDLFLCETLPSIEEATLATRAGALSGFPVWCAVTVDEHDGTLLRSGERVGDAAKAVVAEGAQTVLVNCSPPEVVGTALAQIARHTDRFGAYANGFTGVSALTEDTTVDVLRRRDDLSPTAYADYAMGWADQGASVIGGCCEITPAHIAEIARRRGLRFLF